MTTSPINEAMHPMAPLVSRVHDVSIDEVIIAQNQTIVVGQVLGAVGVSAEESSTNAAAAGNTGNGTMGTVTINSNAVDGAYNIVFLTAGATAEFEVGAPDGTIVGTGKVGTAFAGPIGFTFTTGGVSFAVGDAWTVTVLRPFDEAGEQFEAWSPSATDGSQVATAVALYPVVTGAGVTAKIAAARRDCAVRGADLTWSSGATANQIAEGAQQLQKKNIILR